jgi:hypothetical protein
MRASLAIDLKHRPPVWPGNSGIEPSAGAGGIAEVDHPDRWKDHEPPYGAQRLDWRAHPESRHRLVPCSVLNSMIVLHGHIVAEIRGHAQLQSLAAQQIPAVTVAGTRNSEEEG